MQCGILFLKQSKSYGRYIMFLSIGVSLAIPTRKKLNMALLRTLVGYILVSIKPLSASSVTPLHVQTLILAPKNAHTKIHIRVSLVGH